MFKIKTRGEMRSQSYTSEVAIILPAPSGLVYCEIFFYIYLYLSVCLSVFDKR